MQEYCEDFSDDEGCCLICPDAEPGCLCYECKCTKCYWYSEPELYLEYDDGYPKGVCDLKIIYKKENKRKREKKEKELKEYFKKFNIDYTKICLKKGQSQLNDFKEVDNGNTKLS